MIYPEPFPLYTLDPDGNETAAGWSIVAADPYRVSYYGDDGARAMDETNHDALLAGLDPAAESSYLLRWGPWSDGRGSPGATREPLETVADGDWWTGELEAFAYWPAPTLRDRPFRGSTVVVVARDGSPAADHAESCARSLADYPLLDESAYSAREYAAWETYWQDTARRDVAYAAADVIAAATGADSYDVADVLESHADGWEGPALEAMAYWHGFTGEHDADGAVVAVVEWFYGAAAVLALVADGLAAADRAAAGVVPLPLGVVA